MTYPRRGSEPKKAKERNIITPFVRNEEYIKMR